MNTPYNRNRIIDYGWKNIIRNLLGIRNKSVVPQISNEDIEMKPRIDRNPFNDDKRKKNTSMRGHNRNMSHCHETKSPKRQKSYSYSNELVEIHNLVILMTNELENETKYNQRLKKLLWIKFCNETGTNIYDFKTNYEFKLNCIDLDVCNLGNYKKKRRYSDIGLNGIKMNLLKAKPVFNSPKFDINVEQLKYRVNQKKRVEMRKKVLNFWSKVDCKRQSVDLFLQNLMDMETQLTLENLPITSHNTFHRANSC